MQTRAPRPVDPPQAQSLVTRSGHVEGREMRSTASLGRLQAGSVSARVLAVTHRVGHGAMLLPLRCPPVVGEKLS